MRRAVEHSTRRVLVGVGVVLVALLVTGCGGSSDGSSDANATATVGVTPTTERDAGPPQEGGALSYGIAAESNSLTPGVGQWASSAYIVANSIYEPLAARRTDGTVEPYLAEAITPNADFTEWTIRTRPGITFHDGTPFDADAVVANFDFKKNGALTSAALEPVESVEAVDAVTVKITMNKPWSTFSNALAALVGYMAAPSMFATPEPGNADPVGTGPFVFQSRQIDSNVVVEKNADYWQPGLPHLDRITFEIIPDDTSRSAALRSGDLDAMEVNTPQGLSDYIVESEEGRAQLLTNAGQEANEFVIALNTSKAPFDDLLARQILATAIDQEAMAQILTGGVWPGAWGNFEAGSRFYMTPEEAGYPAPDPARAQELADRYRDEHGAALSFTFQVNADVLSARLGQVVQQQLEPFGVSVGIEQVEQTVSITNVLTGEYEAGFFAMFSAPTLDTGYSFIATEPASEGLSLNYTRLADPDITSAMDAARATGDADEQIAQYRIVQQQMAENLDRIFLYHVRSADAFSNQVHGFTAATFPDSDDQAISPDISYPFFTAMWVER